jgi:hypothetical protein
MRPMPPAKTSSCWTEQRRPTIRSTTRNCSSTARACGSLRTRVQTAGFPSSIRLSCSRETFDPSSMPSLEHYKAATSSGPAIARGSSPTKTARASNPGVVMAPPQARGSSSSSRRAARICGAASASKPAEACSSRIRQQGAAASSLAMARRPAHGACARTRTSRSWATIRFGACSGSRPWRGAWSSSEATPP